MLSGFPSDVLMKYHRQVRVHRRRHDSQSLQLILCITLDVQDITYKGDM